MNNRPKNNFSYDVHLASSQRIAKVGSWEVELENSPGLALLGLYWSDETYRMLGFVPGADDASEDLFMSRVHPQD